MKEILGYAILIAFMITMSTFLLITGVVGLFIEAEPVWLSIVGTIVGFFNLFGWTTGALYSLNQSNTGDKK